MDNIGGAMVDFDAVHCVAGRPDAVPPDGPRFRCESLPSGGGPEDPGTTATFFDCTVVDTLVSLRTAVLGM